MWLPVFSPKYLEQGESKNLRISLAVVFPWFGIVGSERMWVGNRGPKACIVEPDTWHVTLWSRHGKHWSKMDWILILLCEATCCIGVIFQGSWKLYCNRPMFCVSAFTLISGSKFLRPFDGPWQHGVELTLCLLLKSTGLDCASEQLVWIFSELHVSPAYISPGHLRVFLECVTVLLE